MSVIIERLHTEVPAPEYAYPTGTSGFDLICREVVTIYRSHDKLEKEIVESRQHNDDFVLLLPFERALFSTKQHFIIPEGYEIEIRPKSGITLKTGVLVQFGTVDENYTGDLGISVVNCNNCSTCIPLNTKLAQGVLMKVERAEFHTISKEQFDNCDTIRGSNGFGSTGTKEKGFVTNLSDKLKKNE